MQKFTLQKRLCIAGLVGVVLLAFLFSIDIFSLKERNAFEQAMERLQQERTERWAQSSFSKVKNRILFLTTWENYNTFMDRWIYLRYEAAARHPFVEAVMSGPGFREWNSNMSVSENIAKRFALYFYY